VSTEQLGAAQRNDRYYLLCSVTTTTVYCGVWENAHHATSVWIRETAALYPGVYMYYVYM